MKKFKAKTWCQNNFKILLITQIASYKLHTILHLYLNGCGCQNNVLKAHWYENLYFEVCFIINNDKKVSHICFKLFIFYCHFLNEVLFDSYKKCLIVWYLKNTFIDILKEKNDHLLMYI